MPTHHGAETLYLVASTAAAAGNPSTTRYPTTNPGSLPTPVRTAVSAMSGAGYTISECFHTVVSGGGTQSFDYVAAVTTTSPTTYLLVEVGDPSQSVLYFAVPGP